MGRPRAKPTVPKIESPVVEKTGDFWDEEIEALLAGSRFN